MLLRLEISCIAMINDASHPLQRGTLFLLAIFKDKLKYIYLINDHFSSKVVSIPETQNVGGRATPYVGCFIVRPKGESVSPAFKLKIPENCFF